ncbi:glycoside hydrolase family 3 N-terminal domain-containing protein [Eisenbergiella sp.]
MIKIQDETMQEFEREHIETVRRLAAECTLFLKKDNEFPLERPGKIALYGNGARKTIKGGTGSGDVNVRYFVTIEEGLEHAGFTIISKSWLDEYDALLKEKRKDFVIQVQEEARQLEINPILYGMGKVMPEPDYNIPLNLSGELAVYVLSRNSGEGSDRTSAIGDIELSASEIRDICLLNQNYQKFVLVLNVGGMVNLKPVANVKNILLLSQLGTPTGDVLADLLLGKSYPSGKLAMTWAQVAEYPSTDGFGDMNDTYYREGIYVGYRYFDSANKKPDYPFGFGLSYTNFTIEAKELSADFDKIRVVVEVKNTGTYIGKEVVQLYFSKPVGKLDQPYQELAAFAKTAELKPGEVQELEMSFDTKNMESYDTETASYIMEKGEYILRIGNSSRNTRICGITVLDQDVVIRRVKNICNCNKVAELKPKWHTYFGESEKEEKIQARICTLHTSDIKTETVAYETESKLLKGSPKCLWKDVIKGTKSIDDFISSLNEEQLAYLCTGFFDEYGRMESVIGNAANTVSGAAGETTHYLKELGLPIVTMADGPAGLRLCTEYKVVNGVCKGQKNPLEGFLDFMDQESMQQMMQMMPSPSPEEVSAPINYVYCTAIPIGTAIAQSWNEAVGKECGDIVGKEMEQFGIHLWLAPAMNIQRSPLCGRNFEYFSEDPFISGKMAAAITKGVQQHQGCGTTIKHFACNNQETNRMLSNSIVDERALREIYLRGFEICIKEAKPLTVMSSYNLLNGEHTCNSKDLLTDVLRGEWGFEGLVMTDWYATSDIMTNSEVQQNKYKVGIPAGCIKAGNDLIMPGMLDDIKNVLESLENKEVAYPVTKANLQVTARRVLQMIRKLS